LCVTPWTTLAGYLDCSTVCGSSLIENVRDSLASLAIRKAPNARIGNVREIGPFDPQSLHIRGKTLTSRMP